MMRGIVYCTLGILLPLLFCGEVAAQSTELTSHDNHALLYAHQLAFALDGTPTVRMRIADGLTKVRFMPKSDFVVMPSGTGGAVIRLKGMKMYEITISAAKPGSYQYGAIVARAESLDVLNTAKLRYEADNLTTEIVPIGSVFALKGHVFDNRENLLMTLRSADKKSAEVFMSTVALDSSVDSPELYSELMTYPTAMMTLRDESGTIQIEHQNLMWIDLPEDGAVFYEIEGEDCKKGELLLNAQIVVTPDHSGRLSIVQSADIETILRGIVPAEIYASAPEAALMSQAVAARTTLISQVGARHSADPYHLCNKQHCQVYRGLSGADPRTDKAIEKTRGQILFSDAKLVQSYYSAHCGGFSAGSTETWGLPDKSYLVARSDDKSEKKPSFRNDDEFMKWWQKDNEMYCSGAPAGQKSFTSTKNARWKVHFSASEIEEFVKKQGKSIGQIKNVEVVSRGESFRATLLRISGTQGMIEVSRELPIRRMLGGLKSGLFAVQVEKDGILLKSVDIYGAGFGHGVGMCQTGAIGMAQRELHYDAILKHYFPGTHLEKLW